jgi:hypothetical protein
MMSVDGVAICIVECNDLLSLPHLVTNRRLELQFTSRYQAQSDAVLNSASYPASCSNPSNSREPHAGQAAEGIQHIRYDADFLNGFNISREAVVGH